MLFVGVPDGGLLASSRRVYLGIRLGLMEKKRRGELDEVVFESGLVVAVDHLKSPISTFDTMPVRCKEVMGLTLRSIVDQFQSQIRPFKITQPAYTSGYTQHVTGSGREAYQQAPLPSFSSHVLRDFSTISKPPSNPRSPRRGTAESHVSELRLG